MLKISPASSGAIITIKASDIVISFKVEKEKFFEVMHDMEKAKESLIDLISEKRT